VSEPLPICHLDGTLLPLRAARISPLDRSFLFGDGVYEVIAVRAGRARRLPANLARLERSLSQLRIPNPHSAAEWGVLIEQLILANAGAQTGAALADLYVYLQVSRGAEYGRNHAPLPQVAPLVFAFCAPLPVTPAQQLERGVECITAADTRWARCDIKSVALLANVLLRQQALDAHASEAILLRAGHVTEASASSVCVIVDGEIRSPPASPEILPGTTRGLIAELAARHELPYRVVRISERDLRGADEIWLSAATRGVVAVTRLDGRPVGSGRPGPLWRRMHALLEAWWTQD
jgi:D-alanine transaminase